MFIVANLPRNMNSKELAGIARGVSEHVSFSNAWSDGDKTFGLLSFDETADARKAKRRLDGAQIEGERRKLETFSLEDFNESVKRRSRSTSRRRR
jgi:hypothetical protein